jgi:hypothetical protein
MAFNHRPQVRSQLREQLLRILVIAHRWWRLVAANTEPLLAAVRPVLITLQATQQELCIAIGSEHSSLANDYALMVHILLVPVDGLVYQDLLNHVPNNQVTYIDGGPYSVVESFVITTGPTHEPEGDAKLGSGAMLCVTERYQVKELCSLLVT